jgi:hypothetical protein
LVGDTYFGSDDTDDAPWDGENLSDYSDTSANCYFGLGVKEGYVGVLDEMKFFMNDFTRDNFVDILEF